MRRLGVLASVVGGLLVVACLLFRLGAPRPEGESGTTGPRTLPAVQPVSGLGRASLEQMPQRLSGVFLSMEERELTAVRPHAQRHPPADSEQHYLFDERLPEGAQALYLFKRETNKLARVQLAEQLSDVDALAARLEALQATYGPVSGVWDCDAVAGQLPTRRFSWLRGPVGIMDVVLLLGERVMVTLYVGSRDDLQGSLLRASCSPTPPERFSKFPAVPNPP